MNKKFLTMLLALAMLISMVPMVVGAECAHTTKLYSPKFNGTHDVVCNDCGKTTTEDEACTYGEDGTCSKCGVPELRECSHIGTMQYWESNGNGTHKVFCSEVLGGCGARVSEAEACTIENGECKFCHYQKPAEEPKCDHTYVYTSWTCNNDGTHTAKCQCGEWEETVACTFEPGSDVCKFCGYDRSKVEEPEEEVCDCGVGNGKYALPVDATHHNIYCQHDKVVNGPLACTFEDGVCVCGNKKAVETEPEVTEPEVTEPTATTTYVNPNLDVVPKTGSIFLNWLYALIFG